jgi:hypothetical protein
LFGADRAGHDDLIAGKFDDSERWRVGGPQQFEQRLGFNRRALVEQQAAQSTS